MSLCKNNKKYQSFSDNLEHFRKEWELLLQKEGLAFEGRFLRRMAINIRHLYQEAQRAKKIRALRSDALAIQNFLTAPREAGHSLLSAAAAYGEEIPIYSELATLLSYTCRLRQAIHKSGISGDERVA